MLNMRRHLGSKQEFTNWLTTMYLFYLMNRFVDFDAGVVSRKVSPGGFSKGFPHPGGAAVGSLLPGHAPVRKG